MMTNLKSHFFSEKHTFTENTQFFYKKHSVFFKYCMFFEKTLCFFVSHVDESLMLFSKLSFICEQSELGTLLSFSNIDLIVTFLFCFLDLEGQQKTAVLEIYVLAMNIFDQNFIAKLE